MTVGGGGRGLSGAGPMFKKHLGCPDDEASFRVASTGKNMMQCQVGTLSVCMHHNVSFNTFSSVATVTILASKKKNKTEVSWSLFIFHLLQMFKILLQCWFAVKPTHTSG